MSYYTSETGTRNRSSGGYLPTSGGLHQQPLHTLYTGRLMTPHDHYSGDTTPHENEEGLSAQRDIHKALYRAAMLQEEALNRHLGGYGPKVLPHPPVEPDSFSEDPALRSVLPSSAIHDNMVVGSSNKGTGSAIIEERYTPNEKKKEKEKNKENKECRDCDNVREYYTNAGSKGFLSTKLGLGCCGGLAVILMIILIVLYCM